MRSVSQQKIGDIAVLSISIRRSSAARAAVALPASVPAAADRTEIAPAIAQKAKAPAAGFSFKVYVLIFALLTTLGIGTVWNGNKAYGPEMYAEQGMKPAAEAFAAGKNYAVFDLNLNIRKLRDFHLATFTQTPDVVLLGASHWQEAHADLLPNYKFYNAHIHRDYWEDPLGMVDMLVKHNRLPKKMIISVRDNQFVPVELRKDFLWEPGIPYYRDMADRLGLKKQPWYKTLPYERWKQQLSFFMLFENFTRWHKAEERPQATTEKKFKALDVLLPDGSIIWSDNHRAIFTRDRMESEVASFVKFKAKNPPVIDPKGVEAFEAMLVYLKEKGVSVTLAHPPFNPLFYDNVQNTPYIEGMRAVEKLTKSLAAKYGLETVGSFNPHDLGCKAEMYIDAEHSDGRCLKSVFDQFAALDHQKGAKP